MVEAVDLVWVGEAEAEDVVQVEVEAEAVDQEETR